MHSIQSRLTLGLLISLFALFLCLWWLVSNNIQEMAENYTASRIHHDIETLLSAIEIDENQTMTLNQERINPIYQRPFSGHYYTIHYQQQILRSRSLWDQDLQLQNNVASDGYAHSHQNGPDQQPLIVVSRTFKKQGISFRISVAEDLQPLNDSIQHFKNLFAIIAAIALTILLLIQIMILRNGLNPLQKIHKQLRELEQGQIKDLNQQVPTELKPVVYEINHLLNILNKRLKRSRDAIGDLSHSIKKPLTILQQLSEQTHRSNQDLTPNAVWSETLSAVYQQVSNIRQLTDRNLKRARLAGSIHSGSLFHFQQDLPILCQTLSAMYPHKSIQFQTQINGIERLHMDREDMLELLGNLLDNAYKWGRQTIKISVEPSHNLLLMIEDDGPGCEEEVLNYLGQRGVRLDESTHGHGFGLAIVADIVADYQGELNFGRSAEFGGFKVILEFPVTLSAPKNC